MLVVRRWTIQIRIQINKVRCNFSLESDDFGSMRRVKLYLWAYAIKLFFDHDLGEPDDLFADIHNFAAIDQIYKLFRIFYNSA
jgi:hypothetical protein